MRQQTISASSTPSLVIEPIPGDLRVAGWDRSEIMVKTDGDTLEISGERDPIVITCDEDLILYVPRGAKLKVEKVAGGRDPASSQWSGNAWTCGWRLDDE